MFALLIVLALICLFLLRNFNWKRRHLPPGPTPVPIIGNLLSVSGDNQYSIFQEWAAKYGQYSSSPVYTIWIGEDPVLIVTDYEVMRATFIKDGDSYTGRAFLREHFFACFGSVDGIIRTEGEQWKQLRKFFFKAMRDFGMEGEAVENLVLDALFTLFTELEAEVKEKGQKQHSVDRKVDLMSGSVISQIWFSQSFKGETADTDFWSLKQILDIMQEYFASFTSLLIEASPWIRHLPYFSAKFHIGKRAIEQIFAYVQHEVDRRMEARQKPDYSPVIGRRDILDQFLDQVEQTDQADPNNYLKPQYLPAFGLDLFVAGQETTSNTLNFLILYLMLDQMAQEKLHAELDAAMAEKRAEANVEEEKEEFLPVFRQADRPKLHFCNAVVNEAQRLCNLLPINLTHVATRDVHIGGHPVRKGTKIIPQISCVLFDPKIFPNPERFMPERFLDERGQFKRFEVLVPFGVGKRICPGEALARLELFLFTANFFYKFHVYPPNPLDPPKVEKQQKFAVKLPEYQCHVQIWH